MKHKLFLTAFLISIFCFYAYQRVISERTKVNYIYGNLADFNYHLISENNTNKKHRIVVLGSSAVAGNNVPVNTTISDFMNKFSRDMSAYNLATMQGNILTSFGYLKKSLKYRPTDVILGISPDFFQVGVSQRLKHLLPEVAPILLDKQLFFINSEFKKKNFPSNPIEQLLGPSLPLTAQLRLHSALHQLRKVIFGNLFLKEIVGLRESNLSHVAADSMNWFDLLRAYKEVCQKNGINLYIYLEPLYKSKELNDPVEFNKYKSNLLTHLNQNAIEYLDLTNEVPQSNRYFIDFIHLAPDGNELVAKKIYEKYFSDSFGAK